LDVALNKWLPHISLYFGMGYALLNIMASKSRISLFPATQQDVSRLRQSATDAVNDFGNTAATHVSKVSGQLRDLAEHARNEGSQRYKQVRGRVTDVIDLATDFTTERPFVCIGAALFIGILIGLSRRRRPAQE
jgi:ElaB/YqjD/DUF883 family membrane-anchored ribosome-binding protein